MYSSSPPPTSQKLKLRLWSTHTPTVVEKLFRLGGPSQWPKIKIVGQKSIF